jgi:hypothetical protein
MHRCFIIKSIGARYQRRTFKRLIHCKGVDAGSFFKDGAVAGGKDKEILSIFIIAVENKYWVT